MRQLASLAVAAALASPAVAQPERYELGRRLRQFEAAWEEQPDAAARKKALAVLPKVTNQFFSFQFGEAGRTLDEARAALRAVPPTDAERWLTALSVRPAARAVDGEAKTLTVEVLPFYKVKGEVPAGARATLRLRDGPVVTVPLDKLPAKVEVPFPEAVRPSDEDLTFVTFHGEKLVRLDSLPVGRVGQLKKRLDFLRDAATKATDPTAAATLRDYVTLIEGLANGDVPESDVPVAQLLDRGELLAGVRPRGENVGAGPPKAEQVRLTLALGGKRTAPVRVLVPPGLDPKKPVPLVVAMHGAGGSENMFFEAYGAGHVVTECAKRGWLLVTPRSGLVGGPPVADIVAKLAERYPVDAKRVFLVGHSMGAAQAVEVVQQHPDKFAALACLGGTGRVRKAEAFAELPVFVGVGTKDFALGGARALHKALAAGGAKNAALKEYPDVEHLVIVREALPDVFAAWDKLAAR